MLIVLYILTFLFNNSIFFSKDAVRLWDGDYRSRWNRLAWPGFCGSTIPETFVSPSNEMFIRFKSRDAVVGSGFEIRIEQGINS